MAKKKGLKEFLQVYDIWGEKGWLGLDLAQNLWWRFEFAKDKKVQGQDVRLAYSIIDGSLMEAIHNLAKALGYTRGDYIDGADKRTGRGNVNIYVAGEDSVNCSISDLVEGLEDET